MDRNMKICGIRIAIILILLLISLAITGGGFFDIFAFLLQVGYLFAIIFQKDLKLINKILDKME